MKMKKILIALILLLSVVSANAAPPAVDSKSSLLVELSSGTVICENNSQEQLKIASLTKIMTVLLTMEAIERGELAYTDMITCSEYAESMGGSQIFLKVGEQMSVDDIIKAVMVASANDAAIALAEHVGGTYDNFIKMMNNRAKELGMKNTHFADANGLSDDNSHYSTAADIAIMSRELLKHEAIKKYTNIWMDTLRGGEFKLTSTNILLKRYDGITGLKTGYTSEALYCMIATAERDDKAYMSIVLGAPTTEERFEGSERLLDYAFNNIKITDRLDKGNEVGEAKIKRGKIKTVKAVAKESIAAVVEKDAENTERNVVINELKAPVKKGDVIGKIEFVNGDNIIAQTELVASADVEKKGIFDYFSDFAKAFIGIF